MVGPGEKPARDRASEDIRAGGGNPVTRTARRALRRAPVRPGKLVILRGLPGSGKTTRARELVATDRNSIARVSRDDLRAMMIGCTGHGDGTIEQRIDAVRDAVISALLRDGVTVVCDAVNVDPRTVAHLRSLAAQSHAASETIDLTRGPLEVPLEVCLERNATRKGPDHVPPEWIIGIYDRYVRAPEGADGARD